MKDQHTMPIIAADTDMHILTPNKAAIRGTLDTIPACGLVGNLHLEADGSLGFDFEGWAEQWYEDARPIQQPHPGTGRRGFVFVDFEGAEHHEDDLIRCMPEARVSGCPYCLWKSWTAAPVDAEVC